MSRCPSLHGSSSNAKTGGDTLRFIALPDDHLEHSLRRGDYVLVRPVERFAGDGRYLVRNGCGDFAAFHVDAAFGRSEPPIRMWCEHPAYADRHISTDRFADVVVGKVVMTCRVTDHAFLQDRAAT